jgi:GDP/UDP-N,N'-diacetylbacillosamine 2-epimerase (hydrolysing)
MSFGNAFNKLYSDEFVDILKNVKNPYGNGGVSEEILQIIKKVDLNFLIMKSFFNVEIKY